MGGGDGHEDGLGKFGEGLKQSLSYSREGYMLITLTKGYSCSNPISFKKKAMLILNP